MPRIVKLALVCALTAVASLALAAGAGAEAKLTADYRFEQSFKNSANTDVPKLTETGSGGIFAVPIGGGDTIWTWPAGDGLRLAHANRALGSDGKTYTFVMRVSLDAVSNYRKIVDFDNLGADLGWYVYEGSLYPYDLDHVNYDKRPIEPDKFAQIAMTRNAKGVVNGYVDGKTIDDAKDKHKEVALGEDKILHFLLDDSNVAESSGGGISRLRIWDGALSKKKIKHLHH
jgi:hypothetical protein